MQIDKVIGGANKRAQRMRDLNCNSAIRFSGALACQIKSIEGGALTAEKSLLVRDWNECYFPTQGFAVEHNDQSLNGSDPFEFVAMHSCSYEEIRAAIPTYNFVNSE